MTRRITPAVLLSLCLALSLTITPAAIAKVSSDTNQNAQSDMVRGTGTTVAELRDLGWEQDQIAGMQGDQNQATTSPGNQNQPMGRTDNYPQRAESRGNWGLWGLVGLLGLLGLGGRRRSATVRDERDIRRVA